jgi:hypothetical protein
MNHEERVFLAGCIETIIVADSNIEENELENLDKTVKELNFEDFDDCLSEFESSIKDSETFFEKAETITKPEVKDAILKIIYEFLRSNGIPEKSEESLFKRLSKLWR